MNQKCRCCCECHKAIGWCQCRVTARAKGATCEHCEPQKKPTECKKCNGTGCRYCELGHMTLYPCGKAATPEPVEDWRKRWEKLKCETTSASIIGFENDADIKFIKKLLQKQREEIKSVVADMDWGCPCDGEDEESPCHNSIQLRAILKKLT